jgi:hypothetical protein
LRVSSLELLNDFQQAKETWKEINILKLEHTNKVQEIENKVHVFEEEIDANLKEEVSKLRKDNALIMETKDFKSVNESYCL